MRGYKVKVSKSKKLFDRLNKIVFVAGIVALIILVLITVNSSEDIIGGMWGTISFICLLIIFIAGFFATISIVLAIIEGLKKDKVAFLKKFLSNVIWIAIVYTVPYVLDYFYESEFPVDFEFGKTVLRVLITALTIIGGEYMLIDHSKEE